MEKVKISAIKANSKNPRIIKDDKFKKLVKSIKEFPEMLEKRPLVCYTDVDGKYVVLGGNMRLKASQEVGLKEIPIVLADEWTQEQRDEFLIKDNVGFGEWDWDQLANEWDAELLDKWGLDIPNFDTEGFADKNKELSLDDVTNSMTITLKYTEDEYYIVKDAFLKLAITPEQAIWKLLGND
jgi:ParB-like chromosome segregation protein Spo0J